MSNRWQALAASAIGFALALGAAEAGLRAIGFGYPMFYAYDDFTGAKLRAGAEGWLNQEAPPIYIKINSDGLRDREHAEDKPADTFRIAVLGDSFAEGLAVPIEKTFWAVMEERLNACKAFGAKKVEVINFGVSGYGTGQELMTLRRRVWRYSPDMVLLAFTTANDLINNSKTLEADHLRPFFSARDGKLELDDSFLRDPVYKRKTGALWRTYWTLSARCRILQLINRWKTRRQIALRAAAAPKDGRVEAGLNAGIYAAPTTPVWIEAWRDTEALIVEMRKEVEAGGARFFLATLTTGIQVHPDPAARKAALVGRNVDLSYQDKRLGALARRERLDFLALGPSLRAYAERHKAFLHGFTTSRLGEGHWNEEGHRVAGEALAERLCRSVPK